MTDLHSRAGDFAGLSDAEVDEIMRGTVSIIRKYAAAAVSVSCNTDLIRASLPASASQLVDSQEMLKAFRSTYGYMCHLGMSALNSRLGQNGRRISYTFEKGDSGQRGLSRFLNFLQDNPGRDTFLNTYGLARHRVAAKADIEGIFHSSDLIAWEWAKHVERSENGLPMRRSLVAFFSKGHTEETDSRQFTVSGGRFFFRHFTEDGLDRGLAFFRDALTATNVDHVHEAFRRWEESR